LFVFIFKFISDNAHGHNARILANCSQLYISMYFGKSGLGFKLILVFWLRAHAHRHARMDTQTHAHAHTRAQLCLAQKSTVTYVVCD
jgi:hypothetical protein